MRNYLSFGGGVNSVALYLHLVDEGTEFEAVFSDTGCEYPETYEYLKMFQKWADRKDLPQITVLTPKLGNLYDYSFSHSMVPAIYPRWCSVRFKLEGLCSYYQRPCFQFIAIDFGESKRARISTEGGVENRYPLIEAEITRSGCKEIIEKHGLPVPHRSMCYICPFQTIAEWKKLRMVHPDLFCRALSLEQRNMEYRRSKGKKPLFLYGNAKPLEVVVEEKQKRIFARDEYPPCNCAL